MAITYHLLFSWLCTIPPKPDRSDNALSCKDATEWINIKSVIQMVLFPITRTEASCFWLVCPSHSCEDSISGTLWGKSFSTLAPKSTGSNWLGFSNQSSGVKVEVEGMSPTLVQTVCKNLNRIWSDFVWSKVKAGQISDKCPAGY